MSRDGDRVQAPRVTFSIVVPTLGRPSAVSALASVLPQLEPGDELLVVRDESGDYGDSARNGAVARARGTHLAFLDDDDEFLPGGLAAMRAFAAGHPERIGIFTKRIEGWPDRPDVPDLGRTATGNYCVPNLPGGLGTFRAPPGHDGRRGDVAFITETCGLQGPPLFVGAVTQVASPEHSRLRRIRYRVALRTRLRRLLGAAPPRPRLPARAPGPRPAPAAPPRAPGSATFSVIVATSGRPGAGRSVASVLPQLRAGDELLVIRDDGADRGGTARDAAVARARGSHLAFLDEDDEYLPGALETMRRAAAADPARVAIFGRLGERREDGRGRQDLARVSPAMLCVPNLPGRLGCFGGPPGDPRPGAVAFALETVARQGSPVWRDECTSVAAAGARRLRGLPHRLAVRTRLVRDRAEGLSSP